jgi:prepilin-type N-terminal cleavage/methylation domain-containing protein
VLASVADSQHQDFSTVAVVSCCRRVFTMRSSRIGCVLASFVWIAGFSCALRADVDTEPYLFAGQLPAPTGRFEWDEFEGSYVGPHSADAGLQGQGSGQLTVSGTPNPGDAPPFGVLTTTGNLYSGGTFGTLTVALSEVSTSKPFTTIVAQLATMGSLDPSSILLDDMPPIEWIDRGIRFDVVHDTDNQMSALDTRYYWAEWQVTPRDAFELSATAAHSHFSLAAVRLDHFNTATLFDAAAPGLVFVPRVDPDFDQSGTIDVADLDLLCGAVAADSRLPRLSFDLSDDEELSASDVELFLQLAERRPGDVNLDGAVEFDDFVEFAGSFGGAGNWSSGDFDCSGTVEFADFVLLAAEFGYSRPAAAASIPEPGSQLLAWTALWLLLCGRRRPQCSPAWPRRRIRPRRAFSLTELLVVMAVIAAVVSLLLPAVQSAREAARRSSCQNNLRQVTLAALRYTNARNHLPPPKVGPGAYNGLGSTFLLLLPFLEESARFANYDLMADVGSPRNHPITASLVPSYLCPSMRNAGMVPGQNGSPDLAAGSYIISFGTDYNGRGNGAFDDPPENRGIAYQLRLRHITDGLSRTFFFGELDNSVRWTSTGDQPDQTPGRWGDYAWANGYWFNSRGHLSGTFNNAGPTSEQLMHEYRAYRSDHPGGVHFAMMDGSVRFVGEDTDRQALRAAVTRAGNELRRLDR